MSRYIDADALIKRLTDLHDWCRDNRKKGLEQSISIIHDTPTADVVEVVRCKDCKYYQYCETTENGFCNCGKRSEK